MIEYHDATVRVRYAETDQMGVVYHANYLVWFEVGRVELIRALGIEYTRMEKEDDCHIVVADAHCRYQQSARYDEVLRIRHDNVAIVFFFHAGVLDAQRANQFDAAHLEPD